MMEELPENIRWTDNVKPLTDSLPPGQARVLDAIVRHVAQHDYPPTNREIARHLGFASTTNGVTHHLVALATKGRIRLGARAAARRITLT